jgi:hypothetical protein
MVEAPSGWHPCAVCVVRVKAEVDCRDPELKEGKMGVEFMFPRCRKCGAGDLVPLSDFGSQGASIQFKAWVCTNPNCLYNVKIRNGDIIINEPVSDGSMHSYRSSR